ncbi:ribose-phosphate diphosphokinase [Bifidobacterium tissieri]|uniref:Ribose-phosphate pyrophosphokinase n=1 Tax=Bifidobacterium tissieri TaxID=1630162 RepID=A0A5M9ZZ78_9BIFI|nr:ribose-phosphate diphosphokinase [Bifidobacterium tissieri]KAA8832079.1 ribose-phosphate diphosphokinase [Bifidobacterium tissieri]KAA8832900.1 ribose-phosphate diphosphokinase [Bifidobacterium tissieri]
MVSAILEGKPDKNLILVTGRAHPRLATDVADQLGIDILETTSYDFANGEMYVRYTESVRGADVFVLQSHATPVNKAIMEQLIMIDALKRASARSITAVCPMLGYSRQDKKHLGREPISCRLVFDLLATAGADRIMSVDLHAAQSQGFFDGPVDHLIAMPVLVDYVRDRLDMSNIAVVSPDAGRIKVAEQWAQRLGGCPLAFVHKTRDITRPNHAVANRVVGDVKDKDCVLVDDLIDTAGTIASACQVLKNAGARSITVAATHGVLSGPAVERLKNCGAREIVLTDTVPIPVEKRWEGLTVLSIAPLLASAIKAVFSDGSVAELFDTYPTHHGQGFLFA